MLYEGIAMSDKTHSQCWAAESVSNLCPLLVKLMRKYIYIQYQEGDLHLTFYNDQDRAHPVLRKLVKSWMPGNSWNTMTKYSVSAASVTLGMLYCARTSEDCRPMTPDCQRASTPVSNGFARPRIDQRPKTVVSPDISARLKAGGVLSRNHRLYYPYPKSNAAIDTEFLNRAETALQWCERIQLPSGGFQRGTILADPAIAVTFNTGQILLGLAAGVREFAKYDNPMRRAADWLMATQESDGAWRSHPTPYAAKGEKTCETHVAWGSSRPRGRHRTCAMAKRRWPTYAGH